MPIQSVTITSGNGTGSSSVSGSEIDYSDSLLISIHGEYTDLGDGVLLRLSEGVSSGNDISASTIDEGTLASGAIVSGDGITAVTLESGN